MLVCVHLSKNKLTLAAGVGSHCTIGAPKREGTLLLPIPHPQGRGRLHPISLLLSMPPANCLQGDRAAGHPSLDSGCMTTCADLLELCRRLPCAKPGPWHKSS